jgi:hypothetical protein
MRFISAYSQYDQPTNASGKIVCDKGLCEFIYLPVVLATGDDGDFGMAFRRGHYGFCVGLSKISLANDCGACVTIMATT